jgi:hypothetical protein
MVSIAAISAFIGAIVVWQLAVVAVLRLFDIKLPFRLAFYVYPRREHELLLPSMRGARTHSY